MGKRENWKMENKKYAHKIEKWEIEETGKWESGMNATSTEIGKLRCAPQLSRGKVIRRAHRPVNAAWESDKEGKWESGKVKMRENGKVGKWKSGKVVKWESGKVEK